MGGQSFIQLGPTIREAPYNSMGPSHLIILAPASGRTTMMEEGNIELITMPGWVSLRLEDGNSLPVQSAGSIPGGGSASASGSYSSPSTNRVGALLLY